MTKSINPLATTSTITPPKIYINAEFTRLMWLNFNLPLIAVLLFCYAFFIANGVNSNEGDWRFAGLQQIGFTGFWVLMAVLAFLIQRSFSRDIESQFWDQLRMSTLSPWQLTWTRLFIAPVMAWVGLMINTGVLYVGMLFYYQTYQVDYDAIGKVLPMTMADLTNVPQALWLGLPVWSLILAAVGIGALLIIVNLQFGRGQQAYGGSYVQNLLFLILGGFYLSGLMRLLENDFGADWHFLDGSMTYYLCCAGLFAGLALYSAYRSMAHKLYLRNNNVHWLVLGLIAPLLLVGLDYLFMPETVETWYYLGEDNVTIGFNKSAAWLVSAIYGVSIGYAIVCGMSVMAQDSRWEVLALAGRALKAGKFGQALSILPAWVVVLPWALVCLAILPVLEPVVLMDSYPVLSDKGGSVAMKYPLVPTGFYQSLIYLCAYVLGFFVLLQVARYVFPRFNTVTAALVGMVIASMMYAVL